MLPVTERPDRVCISRTLSTPPPHTRPSPYCAPVTLRQAPGSLPVTFSVRSTRLPVICMPPRLASTPTLAGVGAGRVWQTLWNCSLLRYSVPDTGRQEPASSPVTLTERPTSVPDTGRPATVWVRATLGGAPLMVIRAAPASAYCDPVMGRPAPDSEPVTRPERASSAPVTTMPLRSVAPTGTFSGRSVRPLVPQKA